MNLGRLRARVGLALNVAGGGTTVGDELTLLDEYINEAVEQILLRTKVNKKTASVSLTNNVGDYTLDSIMLAFDDAWVDRAAQAGSYNPMLEYIDTYDIRSMRNATEVASGPVSYIAFEGNVIMLYPTPATGDTLHVVYVPRPTAMSSSSHDPSLSPYGEIPSEFHPVIESYAKWKMADYADDGSSQIGKEYEEQYERGIVNMKVLLAKKAGIRVGRARVGRPNHARFASPGVDIGG